MRSDYGTLFVVLVIIGVICFIIIVLGLLYNCWQRRLPKLKHVVSMPGRASEGWSAANATQQPHLVACTNSVVLTARPGLLPPL